MPQLDTTTIVLYDIPHDRTRTKVSEKCLDFGLARFQYSAFHGRLTRNRREELALVLADLIEIYGGKVSLIPVCDADVEGRLDVEVAPPPMERTLLCVYRDHNGASDSSPDSG